MTRGFGCPRAGAAQLEPRSPNPTSATAVSGCGTAGDVAGEVPLCLSLGGHRAEAADTRSTM